MRQFVRVRLIQCNSLNLFQFDYDLTFTAFFLNTDKTIYGRFSTRSSAQEASRDISIEGFRKAMEGALLLQHAYPANRSALEAKTGPPTRFRIPQEFPSLTGKYTPFLYYNGQVARSCIPCQMLGEAARNVVRARPGAMPDRTLFPWPMPNVVGLRLDPKEKPTVLEAIKGSTDANEGFQTGDRLISLQNQPLLSIADVQ